MSSRVLARRSAGPSVRPYVDVRAETGKALNLLRVNGWVVVHEADGSTGDHIVAGPGGLFVVGGVRPRETPADAVARLCASADEVEDGLGVPVEALLCVADADHEELLDLPVEDCAMATPTTIVEALTGLPATLPAATLSGVSRRLVTGRPPVLAPAPAPVPGVVRAAAPPPPPPPPPQPPPPQPPRPVVEVAPADPAGPVARLVDVFTGAAPPAVEPTAEPTVGGSHAGPARPDTDTPVVPGKRARVLPAEPAPVPPPVREAPVEQEPEARRRWRREKPVEPPVTRVELVGRPEPVVPAPAQPPAVLAEPEPATPPGDRMGVRELAKWIAVVVVLGCLGFAVPHAPAAVDWAKGLFAAAPRPIGTTVHAPATTYHPALDVRADQVVDVRATGLARDEHAVAVRLRLANLGGSGWRMGAGVSVRLVDDLGVAHDVASRARPVGLRTLPLAGTVRAHGTLEGYVVFAVPQGRRAWKVQLRLAPAGEGELVWELPR